MQPLRPHRATAKALIAAWLLVPVLAALHVSAEEHRYCAEHGTLEESAAPEAVDSPHAVSDHSSVYASERRRAPGGHELCVFGELATRGDATHLRQGDLGPVVRASGAARVWLGFDTIHAPIALLRAAPKHSPPWLFVS